MSDVSTLRRNCHTCWKHARGCATAVEVELLGCIGHERPVQWVDMQMAALERAAPANGWILVGLSAVLLGLPLAWALLGR